MSVLTFLKQIYFTFFLKSSFAFLHCKIFLTFWPLCICVGWRSNASSSSYCNICILNTNNTQRYICIKLCMYGNTMKCFHGFNFCLKLWKCKSFNYLTGLFSVSLHLWDWCLGWSCYYQMSLLVKVKWTVWTSLLKLGLPFYSGLMEGICHPWPFSHSQWYWDEATTQTNSKLHT